MSLKNVYSIKDFCSSIVYRFLPASKKEIVNLKYDELEKLERQRQMLTAELGTYLYDEIKGNPSLCALMTRQFFIKLCISRIKEIDIALIKKEKLQNETEAQIKGFQHQATKVRCASCGSPLRVTDHFCAVCGEPSSTTATDTNKVFQHQESEVRCASCGSRMDASALFCRVCGEPSNKIVTSLNNDLEKPGLTCSRCGEEVNEDILFSTNEDTLFCTHCGQRITFTAFKRAANFLKELRHEVTAELGESSYEDVRKNPSLCAGREELIKQIEQIDSERTKIKEDPLFKLVYRERKYPISTFYLQV